MQNGLITVAAASPSLKVADCAYNAGAILSAAQKAEENGAKLLVTPELGITGYTCGDLFHQTALLNAAEKELKKLAQNSAGLGLLLVVGLPVRHGGKLYNCAAVLQGGQILGLVPKTHLPNYGEFYERRQFTPGFGEAAEIGSGPLQGTPIGAKLLFRCSDLPAFTLGVEICEDLWVPSPPSTGLAGAGASVIANLSASDETVGKAAYRRSLVKSQSARLVCAYVYADAGEEESTTDMVFSGHNIIAENGETLAQAHPFEEGALYAQVDLQRLEHDRRKLSTYPAATADDYTVVPFFTKWAQEDVTRHVNALPFVPGGEEELAERCEAILNIQAQGLAKRLAHTGAKTAVVGISGGLDSALALLVAHRALLKMQRPAEDILAVTMPCFGTTDRTRGNAEALCAALGVSFRQVDITGTVLQHFKDIGHDPDVQDVTYENAQARMRTLVLMDLANATGGLVVGTGDLSELALGWATYNGDHMSMYGVNASVPKTLIRHLVAYEAGRDAKLGPTLKDILDTPVSPELLPAKDGKIAQQTEELVGPYELHDFFLYYMLRWAFTPGKILQLALRAFGGRYSREYILHWMEVFYRRFFSQQFKRSCLPDGPKVGSVSLSPRGDWRMPSDASAAVWLNEIEDLKQM